LNKIQDYSGQDVAILGQNSEGEGFARVRTHITQQEKQPIKVDYLLRDMNGDWKIYDVTVVLSASSRITGISLIASSITRDSTSSWPICE
jgi:ABC-type transporter MlaC component